jgi:hypothetical protein
MKADCRSSIRSSSTATLACVETTRYPLQNACLPQAKLQGNPAIGGGLESISGSLCISWASVAYLLPTQDTHTDIAFEPAHSLAGSTGKPD